MPPKILSQRRNEAFNVKTFDMKNVTFSYSQESVLFLSLAFLFGIRRGWIWILRIRYSNSFDPMVCAIFALKYFHLAFPLNSHPVTMNWKINTKRNSISTSLFAIAFWWNQITVWECNDIIRRIDNQSDWLVSHRPKNKERINERKKNLIWFMIISPKKLITKARTCKADEVSPTFTECVLRSFLLSFLSKMVWGVTDADFLSVRRSCRRRRRLFLFSTVQLVAVFRHSTVCILCFAWLTAIRNGNTQILGFLFFFTIDYTFDFVSVLRFFFRFNKNSSRFRKIKMRKAFKNGEFLSWALLIFSFTRSIQAHNQSFNAMEPLCNNFLPCDSWFFPGNLYYLFSLDSFDSRFPFMSTTSTQNYIESFIC